MDRTLPVSIAQAEIDQPDSPVVVDQQVLGLEVPVDDVELVDVLDSTDYLLENRAGLGFGDSGCGWGYLSEWGGTFCT